MAKVGFVGLYWTDKHGKRQRTKFKWSDEAARILGPATAVALQKAALEVRRNAQRMMVGGGTKAGRKPLSKPRWWKVGEKDGYPIVAYVKKVPREDKVSSWSPTAFLRNDVQADWDSRTRSMVIGPSKAPWLNQLHEFGGQVNVYLKHTKYPVKEYGGNKDKVPRQFQRVTEYTVSGKGGRKRTRKAYHGAYVGIFNNNDGAFRVGTRTVRGRAYMEIGLQASLGKIPQQFRNTLRYGSIRVFGEKGMRG